MDEVGESDPGHLLSALGRPMTEENVMAISPWRFREPLSPDMAALREGRSIDYSALLEICDRAREGKGALLIEGVGGVMAPLTEDKLVLDWAADMGQGVCLVVGSYLGTISHTLTAYDVLKSRGLRVAGIVISCSADQPVSPEETAEAIGRFTDEQTISILQRQSLSDWQTQTDLTYLLGFSK